VCGHSLAGIKSLNTARSMDVCPWQIFCVVQVGNPHNEPIPCPGKFYLLCVCVCARLPVCVRTRVCFMPVCVCTHVFASVCVYVCVCGGGGVGVECDPMQQSLSNRPYVQHLDEAKLKKLYLMTIYFRIYF
jgi:hypothetical protein